jgi:hypothetical protein
VHVEVITTVSVAPVPDVIGIPLLSSTETAKAGRTTPAEAVAEGSVVKATLLGVVVATVTVAVAAVSPPVVVSFADRTQLVPLVNVTELKDTAPLATVPL